MPHVKENEIIDIKNLNIPNGYCKIEGTVESFRIIVYDRTNCKYVYNVQNGNIRSCTINDIYEQKYEVK